MCGGAGPGKKELSRVRGAGCRAGTAGHNLGPCGENINNARQGPAGVGVVKKEEGGRARKWVQGEGREGPEEDEAGHKGWVRGEVREGKRRKRRGGGRKKRRRW